MVISPEETENKRKIQKKRVYMGRERQIEGK
jgi:hypothetical protein